MSTEEQAREGVSIEAQAERIRAFAGATDRPLDALYVDEGASVKTLKRPALREALRDIRSGAVACVIVHRLDRLTRSVRDLADLIELFGTHEIALVSVSESLDTGTAAGRLMLHILTSVAQWEREAIVERTTAALAFKRRAQRVYGPVPFGYRRDHDRLIPVPEQIAQLARIRALFAAGRSYGEIARDLNAAAIVTARGCRWYRSTVRAVLSSRMATESALSVSACATSEKQTTRHCSEPFAVA